jgi:hypothetical protein
MNAMRALDHSTSDARHSDALVADRIETDSGRLREEFLSMPGLILTVEQVARLLQVPVVRASLLLASLEADGFLMCTPSRQYRLAEPFRC